MTEPIAVILTALPLEYNAVRKRLAEVRERRHERGTIFELGTVPGTSCRIAISLTGKGNNSAAVLAERAIQEFEPTAVLFTGVAGALWDTMPLGDIVVASHVYAYHGGTSEDDGLKARPRAWEAPHAVAQLAARLTRTGEWRAGLPTTDPVPQVHFGPIAAGEIVQNSRRSYEAQWIRQTYNDALAIEMESAGVAQAGHLSGFPVAIVRGISDRADGSKGAESDRSWQPRAAANAAAFAVQLARELTAEQEHPTMRRGDTANHGSVTNIATGQVGIQAGHVTSSTVWMGPTPAPTTIEGLAAELTAFRIRLTGAHANGSLDDVTYEGACAELDLANTALKNDEPTSKGTFILALKRLRGLIADVADLATQVAALVTAAKRLS